MSEERSSVSTDGARVASGARRWLQEVVALPNDDRRKVLFVAVALCLVCSLVVSVAAVALKPLQTANAQFDLRRNLLLAAGLVDAGATRDTVESAFGRVEARLVDLRSGEFSEDEPPLAYDARAAVNDAGASDPIPDRDDIARIRRRSHYAVVYLVKDGERIEQLVLPVHGYGLWSTLYGFVALEPDLRTVAGLKFYEHGETAGLGAEVDNPNWLARWRGKVALDDTGQPIIEVVKGAVTESGDAARSQVDGLSGATLTSNGVQALLRYWLGEQGFGPFLQRLRASAGA